MKRYGRGLRNIGALLLVLSLSLSALYSDGNPYQELLQITNDFVVVSENFKKSLDGFETRLNSLENSNTIQTESYNVLVKNSQEQETILNSHENRLTTAEQQTTTSMQRLDGLEALQNATAQSLKVYKTVTVALGSAVLVLFALQLIQSLPP